MTLTNLWLYGKQIVVWAWNFNLNSGEELYPGHGSICWKLCSSKVENSEEKTRRLRIRSSAEFLYSMTCVVICSHRRSHLKSFLQGIFIGRIGGGTFTGWDKTSNKHTSEGNKPNESTSGQDKVICRSKVESLRSLTHWSCHYNRDKGTAVELKWLGSDLKHLCLARHLLVRTWIQIKHRNNICDPSVGNSASASVHRLYTQNQNALWVKSSKRMKGMKAQSQMAP